MLKKIMWVFFVLIILVLGAAAAVCVYLITALFSPQIVFSLLSAGVVFWGWSYALLRIPVRKLGLRRPRLGSALIGLGGFLVFASFFALPNAMEAWVPAAETAPAVITALQDEAVPLTAVDAGHGFDDLQALKPFLAGKRIVALGEATHGTSEFFRMKHRMVEFLVQEMGYRHFGMETSGRIAAVINDYISGEDSSPQTVIYWPWATAEFMDMLDWMRAFNAQAGDQPIVFHGIDPIYEDRDRVMAQNVDAILNNSGPDSKIILWAHNAHISNAPGWMGSYLKDMYGEQAYLVGFEFNQGSFTSRMATTHIYSVPPAPEKYYAAALAKTGQPLLFLDFTALSRNADLNAWLEEPHPSHDIAELYAINRLLPAWHSDSLPWPKLYDAVIYIESSTPSVRCAGCRW